MIFFIIDGMFMICPKCDFEWHEQDGEICPICSYEPDESSIDQISQSSSQKAKAGMFFDSKRLWAQALAIISIVCLFVLWASAG